MKYRITGLSKHNFINFYDEIKLGTQLFLFRDKDNKFDTRATGVSVVESNDRGYQIGWIPKADNTDIAALLDVGFKFSVHVTKLHIDNPLWNTILEVEIRVIHTPDKFRGVGYVLVGEGINKRNINISDYMYPSKSYAIDIEAEYKDDINYTILKNRSTKEDYSIKNPCKEIFLSEALNKLNKEKEQTIMQKQVDNNKVAATSAAYLESGRIVLSQVTKVASAKAPLLVKGYIDTPFGKLVLANLLQMAQEQFRPTDVRLKKLSTAALTAAYQEVYQSFDIEKLLEDFLDNAAIKQVMQKED